MYIYIYTNVCVCVCVCLRVCTADHDYFLFLLPLLSPLIALGQTHFELNSPHLGQKTKLGLHN